MNRAGLLVVAAALVLAVVTGLSPARAQEARTGNITIAAVLDASIKSAPLLSRFAQGDSQVNRILDGRDLQVIQVSDLLDESQSEVLRDLLSGSDVLRQNTLLVHAALTDSALAEFLEREGVSADNIVAIDIADAVAEPVTVYVFKAEER